MESASLSNSFQFPLLKFPNALINSNIVGGTDMRYNPKPRNVRIHRTQEGSWAAHALQSRDNGPVKTPS